MKNVYYNETKLGSIITNRILSAEEILYLIDVDMDKYAAAHGWNGWDINDIYTMPDSAILLAAVHEDDERSNPAVVAYFWDSVSNKFLSNNGLVTDATAVFDLKEARAFIHNAFADWATLKEFDKPKLNVIHGSTAEETFTSMVQEWIYDQENSEEIEWVDGPIYDEDVDCWYQTLKDNESEFDVGVEVDGVNIRVIS